MNPEEIAEIVRLINQDGGLSINGLVNSIPSFATIFAFILYVVGRLDKKIEGLIQAQSKLVEAQSLGLQEIGRLFQNAIETQAKLQRADNIERDKRFYKLFESQSRLLDKLTNGND